MNTCKLCGGEIKFTRKSTTHPVGSVGGALAVTASIACFLLILLNPAFIIGVPIFGLAAIPFFCIRRPIYVGRCQQCQKGCAWVLEKTYLAWLKSVNSVKE